MSTFTLFDEITKVSNDGVDATDLVKYLLQVVGHDVCSFRRNALTSYRIVSKSGEIYKEINRLAVAVDSDDRDVWDNYNKYTTAIYPLEDLLFKLADIAEHEAQDTQWFTHASATNTIGECISWIEDWAKYRQELRDFATLLDSTEPLKGLVAELNSSKDGMHQYDDWVLLSELCTTIASHSLNTDATIKQQAKTLLGQTKDKVISLPAKVKSTTSDKTMEQSIRSAMLVYGAMDVSINPAASTALKSYLKSPKVWHAAKELLTTLVSHLEKTTVSSAKEDTLKRAVTTFETLLKSLPGAVDLPAAYKDLKIFVKKIRRPYQCQAFAILSQLLVLATHFCQMANKTGEDLAPLTAAIDAAKKALDSAAAAMTGIGEFTEDIPTSDAGLAFVEAETKNKECFDYYGLTSKWNVPNLKKISAAVTEDKAHVDLMNLRFNKSKYKTKPSTTDVSFTLNKPKADNSAGFDDSAYTLEGTTRLSAIMWKEVASIKPSLQGWRFEHKDGSVRKRIGLDKEVKDIVGGTLYLVKD